MVSVQWVYECDEDNILIYLFALFIHFIQNSKYSNADCKCQLRRQVPAHSQQQKHKKDLKICLIALISSSSTLQHIHC